MGTWPFKVSSDMCLLPGGPAERHQGDAGPAGPHKEVEAVAMLCSWGPNGKDWGTPSLLDSRQAAENPSAEMKRGQVGVPEHNHYLLWSNSTARPRPRRGQQWSGSAPLTLPAAQSSKRLPISRKKGLPMAHPTTSPLHIAEGTGIRFIHLSLRWCWLAESRVPQSSPSPRNPHRVHTA